jgi:DNA polymerase III subunit beta
MKLSTLQENIKQGVYSVGHVAGKNINLPILNNILIEAKDGNIKLAATNLEIAVVNRVRGKIETEGVITVDAKVITDYISILPNKKVDIEVKDNKISLSCENYKTKISGQSAEDFPLIPQVEREEEIIINAEEFKKGVAQVIFAVSTNETRLELTGVLFDFIDGLLMLAATDSYRLAEKKIKIKRGKGNKDVKQPSKIIVPARTLQELLRVISTVKDGEVIEGEVNEIKMYISDSQILFTYGTIELVSRLIEGQYPDYKQIIPATSQTQGLINKSELSRAVKASAIFSRTGINDINVDLPGGKNQVVISSASGQTGENITELDAKVQGADNGAVVNYKYLLDGLNNIDDENVRLEIIDSNTPCILKPEKADDYVYIIMPIKQ